jgi:DNA-binding Lrp family transcriptional regulator
MLKVKTLKHDMLDIELDATDIRILGELQRDGSLTNVELASRVTSRRLHAWRE